MLNIALVDEWATLAGLGFATYLATNLDNLVILTAFIGGQAQGVRVGRRAVLISAVIVLIAAVSFGAVLSDIPAVHMRWLGLVPLCLGLWTGWQNWRTHLETSDTPQVSSTGAAVLFPAILLLLSNSFDSLVAVTPLMVETLPSLRMGLSFGIIGGALLVCAVLGTILQRKKLRNHLARNGVWFAPLVMIGVGLYILLNTGTDTL